MKKALVAVEIAIITVSLLSQIIFAASWEEVRSGVQFRVDNKTGNTQIGFCLFMNCDPVPNCIEMTVDWNVYPVSTPDTRLDTDLIASESTAVARLPR